MSLLAHISLPITNKSSFGLSIAHIVFTSTDKKMVWINAKRIIACVASIKPSLDTNLPSGQR